MCNENSVVTGPHDQAQLTGPSLSAANHGTVLSEIEHVGFPAVQDRRGRGQPVSRVVKLK